MNSAQYVGHTIYETGLSFSAEKLEEVVKFIKPTTQKELRSFLGLASYFRDHIRDHSMIVQPLHVLLSNYKLESFPDK